jgi:hypothetical protein
MAKKKECLGRLGHWCIEEREFLKLSVQRTRESVLPFAHIGE